ncbi:hypothetical protein O7635_35950 [Asanoa sp. WMMD1127]|uniref:hypothetical protein n=1 Tax=Asanoa sp. WMMD1127 TaxID=3016107 RepID=UPI00241630EC|nr:hypothetical protein [Asanoa sp. WMMD1127]MDG4827270.1 hypothetical protein [Asanoa sp. WMMD1127]
MLVRPTAVWRETVAREAAALAAGSLDPADAFAVALWPEAMIRETEAVLDLFEDDVTHLVRQPATDRELSAVIEVTVKALNAVNARHGGRAYETGERELLCAYIEHVLDDAGIDVDAFAARHRLTRHEITDRWRTW